MKIRKEEKDIQKRKKEMEKATKEMSKANQSKENKIAVSVDNRYITLEPHSRLCSSLFLSTILLFPEEVPGQAESSNKLHKN